MSRVNGQVKVDRGRIVWELLARPSIDYAAELWCTGGYGACRKLESAQMKMGKRLLKASNTVAGVAVQGDLGFWKLEKRRKDVKLMFDKRLEVLEEGKLVKRVILRENGGIGWWEEYEVLGRS